MISQLSQETIIEYASDAQTIQEPQGADYSRGVQVGKTVPAKWWNWLFNAVTKRASQSKADAQDMLTELQNVVTDAGITLDSTDNDQMVEAIEVKAGDALAQYVLDKQGFLSKWQPNTEVYADGAHCTPAGNNIPMRWFESINGVYLARINPTYPNSVSGMLYFMSFDLIHWSYAGSLNPKANSYSYDAVSNCAPVYFQGKWYVSESKNNDDYTVSYGTHYRDYLCYSDTCTSLLKGSTNAAAVRIGHNPICPVCGEEHSNEESLHCGDDHVCLRDENHVECARCGAILCIEEAFRDEDTGSYYCDYDCANNDGVYYCENVGEWHSVDVFYDDYADEYFYDPDEERIEIGCFCFQNEENANEYGYFQDEDGNWTRE